MRCCTGHPVVSHRAGGAGAERTEVGHQRLQRFRPISPCFSHEGLLFWPFCGRTCEEYATPLKV
eukprot:2724039-Amphidinium_carterae.1